MEKEYQDFIFSFPLKNFNPDFLMEKVKNGVVWEERMKARKTSSYGKSYNYNGITHLERPFTKEINDLALQIQKELGYLPNNCLINYYYNNESYMGFHSDDIEVLEEGTGITILSLGSLRIMKFRSIYGKNEFEIDLLPGEFIHMSSVSQLYWKHAVPPCKKSSQCERISLTFRKIVNDKFTA